ncbi:MAG: DUF1549 domain-containing protein [Deltaproteobacteria bacterium]|nr:DUF1549 domain-containing protein [Deltaproteobacteria bacterium]
MKSAILLVVLSLAAAVHCGRGKIIAGEAKCDADPCSCNKECPTVVDSSLRDAFKCRLLPITEASDTELCRRLFVDIVGRLPTQEDYASVCQGQKVDAIVDALIVSTDYVTARQKLWADRFGYNDARTWYLNTLGLDVLVSKLYREEIDITTFVTQAAIHPALLSTGDNMLALLVDRSVNPKVDPRTLAKSPVDGYVDAVFGALMLRSPTVEETAEFANLYRMYEIDPVASDPGLVGYAARRIRVQPCACAGAKKAFCRSSNAIGPAQDVSLPLRFPAVADCAAEPGNAFYLDDAPEKNGPRPEELNALSAPGRLLVIRPDFHEQHVKETLKRLLGYDPASTLDEETAKGLVKALTDSFKASGSLRALEASIFRSVLYRQAQTPSAPAVDCEGKDSPVFAGPRKRLDADAYFSSIAALTSYSFGKCDYRFQTRTYPKNVSGVTVTAYAPIASIYSYDVKTAATDEPELSGREKARTIGACVDRTTVRKQDDAGPFFLMSLDYLTREACETTSLANIAPGSGTDEASLQAIADLQFQRFFLTTPSPEEKSASVLAMQSCLQSPNTCPPDRVGRRFCSAMLKSARFATY